MESYPCHFLEDCESCPFPATHVWGNAQFQAQPYPILLWTHLNQSSMLALKYKSSLLFFRKKRVERTTQKQYTTNLAHTTQQIIEEEKRRFNISSCTPPWLWVLKIQRSFYSAPLLYYSDFSFYTWGILRAFRITLTCGVLHAWHSFPSWRYYTKTLDKENPVPASSTPHPLVVGDWHCSEKVQGGLSTCNAVGCPCFLEYDNYCKAEFSLANASALCLKLIIFFDGLQFWLN